MTGARSWDGMELAVLVGGRQAGKTRRLLEWVAYGERTNGYPGWSRVLIVHSVGEVMRLRSIIRATDPPMFLDDAHRIYHLEDWQTALVTGEPPVVALDSAEIYLARLVRGRHQHCWLGAIAITGAIA